MQFCCFHYFRKVNDGQWGWRALRLLAKKSPHFFTYGNNPIGKLNEYLETMLRKMSPALQQSLLSQTTGNILNIIWLCNLLEILTENNLSAKNSIYHKKILSRK